jgi:predicted DCC family thiol-disulfide oxidoreductase YuxK
MASPDPPSDLIVYDAQCILCSSFVNFVVKHDRRRRFRLVAAQSAFGRSLYVNTGLSSDALETNLTIVNGRTHTKLGAFAAAMNAIGWPWIPSLARLVSWSVNDFPYDRVARNRLVFNRGRCPVPTADMLARLVE